MSDTDTQLDAVLHDLVGHMDRVIASRKRNREQVAEGRKKRRQKMEELIAENFALVQENQSLKQALTLIEPNWIETKMSPRADPAH